MLITTEQAKGYLKLNSSLNTANFAPFIPDAEEKYIKPFLGNELFALLESWAIEKDTEENPELAALYPYVVAAISRFTFLIAAPHLDIHIGEQGFGVISSQNIVPASRERVKDLIASIEKLAWDNIEKLLRFLEANKDDYLEWVNSEAFTMNTHNLINSAEEYNKYVNIDSSRLTFHRIRQYMTNTEDIHVKPLISEEQFLNFIESIRDNEDLSVNAAKALNHLKAFVANHVAQHHLDNQSAGVAASFHYAEARAIINKFPEDFPDYADSSNYDGAEKPFTMYVNSKDSAIFSAL